LVAKYLFGVIPPGLVDLEPCNLVIMSNSGCFDDLIMMCCGCVVFLAIALFELAFALPLGLFYGDTNVVAGMSVFCLVWIMLAHWSALWLSMHLCNDPNKGLFMMRILANLGFAGWSLYGVYLLAINGREGHAGTALAVLAALQVTFSGVFFVILISVVLVINDCKVCKCECGCWRAIGRLAKAWQTCQKEDWGRVCNDDEDEGTRAASP
jgi:hypothetical protein